MTNRCSVIIISYHTGPIVFSVVKHALRQQPLTELILVNNGNPPAVLTRLQQMALTEPRLKIITGDESLGIAKGYNTAVAQATGEYIVLLAANALLPPLALQRAMDGLQNMPRAMLVGGMLKNADGTVRAESFRPILTPQRFFGAMNILRCNKSKLDLPQQNVEVPAISDAFMCMRKSDYDALGGFDEDYFVRLEDMDLCVRVHQAGGAIICVPRIEISFFKDGVRRYPSRLAEWHEAKGLHHYFDKHFRKQLIPGAMGILKLAIWVRSFSRQFFFHLCRFCIAPHKLQYSRAAKRVMALASGLIELQEKQDWENKTILVTGATGQVGLCVIRRMLASGASVLALTRGTAIPYAHERLQWIQGDLQDPDFTLGDYAVDVVVHCASLWYAPATIPILARAGVKRIIAFGSTSVFTKALSENAYEKDVVERLKKAEMELAAKSEVHGIQWTLLRPTLIYGLGLDANITSLAKSIDALRFFPVYPPAFGRRQPVHADDLAIAVMQALSTGKTVNKAYNLAGKDILTYREMLERIFHVCKIKPWIIPTTLLPFILDVVGLLRGKPHMNGEIARRMNEDLVFFHDEATQDFDYRPRGFLISGIKDIEGF